MKQVCVGVCLGSCHVRTIYPQEETLPLSEPTEVHTHTHTGSNVTISVSDEALRTADNTYTAVG